MRARTAVLIVTLITAVSATRLWTEKELKEQSRAFISSSLPQPELVPYGPRRFNYLKRVKWLCDFLVRYQVADSASPEFGGIIEAEHLPSIIETDNTQEAIWVWTRWHQLTGNNDYQENLRRAWIYVRRHPAYQEHEGNPANIWYAVWNCGLGMWAELLYRQVYHDSCHQPYADSCRDFYLAQPLNPANYLDNFVIAQASGMAYDYARQRNDRELLDTALARGIRVRNWIEAAPRNRLSYQTWAMSGGTAFWGVARTFGQADTILGRAWVATYAESLPGFYPSGTWNCSHNIWLAYAYRAAAEITGNHVYQEIHHYLTDTLLMKDTDLDGGIPATWTDPPTQDQTWVSTYLYFMGMDGLIDAVYEQDVAVYEFLAPAPGQLYIAPATISPVVRLENVGRTPISGTIHCQLDSFAQTQPVTNLPVWQEETLEFNFPQPLNRGVYNLMAFFSEDENPKNDSVFMTIKVYGRVNLAGQLIDSVNLNPISARIKARLYGQNTVWDSCITDTTGHFSLHLIDSIFNVTIEPQPPYYRRTWSFALTGDTNIILRTSPAQVMIVNNDTLENYADYYTSTLDTLEINHCLWSRRRQGPIPLAIPEQLEKRTIIWFSGNSRTQTVPAVDQETLTLFVSRGGNLLLTGQNIAEELQGTPFLETLAGCRFDSSGYSGFLVFGNRTDPLGRDIPGTATAGGNGANNQTSRDIISPVNGAARFLLYDTVTNRGAGVRNQTASGGRIITLGFGFEAVNRPASRPDYFTRVQLMNTMLHWLFYGTGIAEPESRPPGVMELTALPSIVLNRITVKTPVPAALTILDALGRRVLTTRIDPGETTLNLSYLPEGVYFIKAEDAPPRQIVKIK